MIESNSRNVRVFLNAKLAKKANENEQLQNRVKELEVMLRKLATASDCYLEEMIDTGISDASEFADTITEAEQLYQKQAGFKDDKVQS